MKLLTNELKYTRNNENCCSNNFNQLSSKTSFTVISDIGEDIAMFILEEAEKLIKIDGKITKKEQEIFNVLKGEGSLKDRRKR